MTDKYNTPHRDEILAPIIDTNGQPQIVYNVKKIADGTTLWENVYLELVNQIIQNGTWATADVINNIIGKTNAQTELIATLMLLAELKDNIRSTGNDNLEVFGISDAARIGVLNNHSDFGVLVETVAAGENQITVINASGYRFKENITSTAIGTVNLRSLQNGCKIKLYKMDNSDLIYIGDQIGKVVKIDSNSVITNLFSGTDRVRDRFICLSEKLNLWIKINHSSNTSKGVSLFKTSQTTQVASISTAARWVFAGFFNDVTNEFYLYFHDYSTNELSCYKSQVMSESSNSITLTLVGTPTIPNVGTDRFQQFYKKKGTLYAIGYGAGYNDDPFLYILNNNYLSFQSKSVNSDIKQIFDVVSNGSSYLILGLISNSPEYECRIYRFSGGKINLNDTATEISIPFLNGRIIIAIWESDGIYYMSGSESLFGYSLDGIQWTEIINNDDATKNSTYSVGVTGSDGIVNVMCSYGNSSISKYESFNPESFKNKRYKLGNEFITVTDVQTVSDDIILNLQNDLFQNHTVGAFIQRTSDSTIQPNSTQTITVEIDNLYSHNAAVAIPIFTSLENVTVTAEICQRNNETEIEEWVPFPLINSLDVRGWKKNTYFKVFEQAKMVTAIAFTVVNNNDVAVELHQLNIGLSDEIYELGGE